MTQTTLQKWHNSSVQHVHNQNPADEPLRKGRKRSGNSLKKTYIPYTGLDWTTMDEIYENVKYNLKQFLKDFQDYSLKYFIYTFYIFIIVWSYIDMDL